MKTGKQTYSSAIDGAENYTRWVLSTFTTYMGQNLLEVGLGHGGYRKYLPQNITYIGLDIDADSVNAARERYPDDKFIVADITDDNLSQRLTGHGIDTILCVNVLEHIEDDRGAVQNLLSILNPSGHLLIFVPAFQALYSDMDRLAGHHRRYSKGMIESQLEDNAKIIKTRFFNSLGGIGWWINKLIQHDSLDSDAINFQIRLFDRIGVPVAKAMDYLTNSFFGQSIILIIVKS